MFVHFQHSGHEPERPEVVIYRNP